MEGPDSLPIQGGYKIWKASARLICKRKSNWLNIQWTSHENSPHAGLGDPTWPNKLSPSSIAHITQDVSVIPYPSATRPPKQLKSEARYHGFTLLQKWFAQTWHTHKRLEQILKQKAANSHLQKPQHIRGQRRGTWWQEPNPSSKLFPYFIEHQSIPHWRWVLSCV